MTTKMKIPNGFREAKVTERTNVWNIKIRDINTREIKDEIRLIQKRCQTDIH